MGKTVTVILVGGDKSSRDRDIKTAKTLLKNLED
jgi:putative component of toxin-antitoxin plasmid stabilization module